MNELLKFGIKAVTALFALGAGAKLGQDAIEHGKKVKTSKKENNGGK